MKARLVKLNWGDGPMTDLWRHVEETTQFWKEKFRDFHENRLPDFARIYKGTPMDEVKNTPWPNAANNTIQVVGTHCDQLLSRVMAIYMVDPLWALKTFGDYEGAEDHKKALEGFMSDMALSSQELDLYRIEEAWFSGTIRNGTGIIKLPWEYHTEKALVPMEFADASEEKFEDVTVYDGPRPINIPLNKFLNDNTCIRLDDSEFKCHIVTMTKVQLLAKVAEQTYDKAKIDKIIDQPDRSNREILQQYIDETQGITISSTMQNAEYDLYECWLKYWHNGQKYSICCIHHPKSKTRLIAFFNFYPKNMEVFEDAKLAYDDEQWLGYGFAEMLSGYQEEISTTHNQRTDAGSLNNTTAFRVDPSTKLHSILTFYPGCLIPAKQGEIERLDTSNPHASDTTSETLTNAYAKERSGIDPAIGGTGGGVVNSKRGNYSSQGTFAVLQQQNNRTSLRTSDIRSSHARAGQKLITLYSHFGIGSKLSQFGDKGAELKQAMEMVKNGRLGVSMRSATASINKEVEKQNDLLLSSTLQGMYAGDAQVLQAIATPGAPPELVEYYVEMMKAKQHLMRSLLRSFGKDDTDELIPVPSILKEKRNASINGVGNGQGNQKSLPQQTGSGPTVPIPGNATTPSIPN